VSAQQSVPDTASAQLISTALDTTEVSLAVAKFLQTVDQANNQKIDQTIAGLCPARNCSKDAISEAADELSNLSFIRAGNISKALSVSAMSPAQYQSYVRTIVTARAKQTGYTVQ
jgi:hypothetical protein